MREAASDLSSRNIRAVFVDLEKGRVGATKVVRRLNASVPLLGGSGSAERKKRGEDEAAEEKDASVYRGRKKGKGTKLGNRRIGRFQREKRPRKRLV